MEMVADAVWKTIVLAYRDPDDRSGRAVSLPADEVISALMTCAAQITVSVSDAALRQSIISNVGPLLDRAVKAGRMDAGLRIPDNHNIILPH